VVGLPYRLGRRLLARVTRPERFRAVLSGIKDGRRAYSMRRAGGERER
jgi:hypothetical protein